MWKHIGLQLFDDSLRVSIIGDVQASLTQSTGAVNDLRPHSISSQLRTWF